MNANNHLATPRTLQTHHNEFIKNGAPVLIIINKYDDNNKSSQRSLIRRISGVRPAISIRPLTVICLVLANKLTINLTTLTY